MATDRLLEQVKKAMLISGDYQDEALKSYIDEVSAFMVSAGIPRALLHEEDAVGLIIRGVIDLWNYGAGNARLSEYFIQRLLQLEFTEFAGCENADV